MRVYGITDIGKARSINQDSYAVEMLEDAETGILLVCDGMGGVKGGVALFKALESAEFFFQFLFFSRFWGDGGDLFHLKIIKGGHLSVAFRGAF